MPANFGSGTLGCPEPQLEVVDLGGMVRGVRGCERKATYVWQCGETCAWVMNTDATRER